MGASRVTALSKGNFDVLYLYMSITATRLVIFGFIFNDLSSSLYVTYFLEKTKMTSTLSAFVNVPINGKVTFA